MKNRLLYSKYLWIISSTRTWQKSDGTEISSCINWHILTNYNVAVSWAKEISILLGCSANNWMEQHLLSFVVGIEQTAMMHKCLDCLAVKQTVYSCVYCCKKPVILYKNVYFSANRHDCSTRHGTWVQLFFFHPQNKSIELNCVRLWRNGIHNQNR